MAVTTSWLASTQLRPTEGGDATVISSGQYTIKYQTSTRTPTIPPNPGAWPSSIPLQTLQHLSPKAICSDSAQLSSGQGSLGTTLCIVLSCDGQRETSVMSHCRGPVQPPPSTHTLNLPQAPGCNYECNYSCVALPLPHARAPPCVFITNQLLISQQGFFYFQITFLRREKTKLSPLLLLLLLLLSSTIYIMIHDASLIYKQRINLLDNPCVCV